VLSVIEKRIRLLGLDRINGGHAAEWVTSVSSSLALRSHTRAPM
jgi:hypothetical protein